MITFFLHAKPVLNGQLVELTIYQGTYKGTQAEIGTVCFTPIQWALFRVLLGAGIKNCRVPVQLLDGTQRKKD